RGRVQPVTAAGFSHRVFRKNGPFDLVVANILAGPLHDMAGPLCQHLHGNGTLILSGLLPHQRSKILARYRAEGLRHLHTHNRDGWIVLIMERPLNPKAG
ncbi:MAG: 50S ribosomal protein L11 methyltransferase, partial [Pseudomonadota bacterium]